MTDKEIFELARKYLSEESLYFPAESNLKEWKATPEQLLQFGRSLYDKGWDNGRSALRFGISFDEHLGY